MHVVVIHCCHKSYHSLVIFARDAIEALNGHALHRNVMHCGAFEQGVRQLAAKVFLHQHLVDLLARFNGFYHGTNAKHHL